MFRKVKETREKKFKEMMNNAGQSKQSKPLKETFEENIVEVFVIITVLCCVYYTLFAVPFKSKPSTIHLDFARL